jgi:hypothetical protein
MSDTFTKFPSLAYPAKYGYIYDSGSWKTHALVDMHMLMFETYGDGHTQHSPELPIVEQFTADYLNSLAAAMLADPELADTMTWRFPHLPDPARIAFAASVIDNDETGYAKPRYYSLEFLKVTSADKRHDKRWERIERRHDGSGGAIYNMLHQDYARGLENFVLADAIRGWLNKSPKHGYGSMAEPTEWLKWHGCWSASDPHVATMKSNEIRQAIDVIRSIIEASRNLRNAKAWLDDYRRGLAEQAAAQQPQLTSGE